MVSTGKKSCTDIFGGQKAVLTFEGGLTRILRIATEGGTDVSTGCKKVSTVVGHTGLR